MRLNACKVYCAVMDTTSHDNRGPWTRNMILFFTLKKSITLRPPLSVCHFCRSVRLFYLGERLERAVTPKACADGDAPRARHAHVALMGAIADLGQVRHRVAAGMQPAGGATGRRLPKRQPLCPKPKIRPLDAHREMGVSTDTGGAAAGAASDAASDGGAGSIVPRLRLIEFFTRLHFCVQ